MNVAAALWMLYARKDYKTFCRGAQNFQKHQRKILEKILQSNAETLFGKNYKFKEIASYTDFASNIPISDYTKLEPYIKKQVQGEKALFAEGLSFVETTSGSTASAKLIPYNPSLRRVFSRMANVWMYGLSKKYNSLGHGTSYWSLSPAMKSPEQAEGVEDDEYLNGITRALVSRILAVPANLAKEQDPVLFYDKTWIHLLSQKRLVFFSVWSPSFLIRLLRHLHQRKAEILQRGSELSNSKKHRLKKRLAGAGEEPRLGALFPECKIISCWCDAQAKVHLDALRELLGPGIAIQPKGLLSTEGVVSFPIDNGDPVLAYNSHFYEFKDGSTGILKRAHQLEVGGQYEVIMTTQAGLYRYNSRDLVEVTGFWKGVPRLRFKGRSNLLADFVGEKLSWQQALAVFDFLKKQGVQPFAFTWQANSILAGYTILTGSAVTDTVMEKANAMLCENPYFAQAQKLGQMATLRTQILSAEAMQELVENFRKARGIAEGDFKTPLFIPSEFLTK